MLARVGIREGLFIFPFLPATMDAGVLLLSFIRVLSSILLSPRPASAVLRLPIVVLGAKVVFI
jgi:hypothetical protein